MYSNDSTSPHLSVGRHNGFCGFSCCFYIFWANPYGVCTKRCLPVVFRYFLVHPVHEVNQDENDFVVITPAWFLKLVDGILIV